MSEELKRCMQNIEYVDKRITDYVLRHDLSELIHDLCEFALDCSKRIEGQKTGSDERR